jgi:nitrogenase-stabilizing/protective protein
MSELRAEMEDLASAEEFLDFFAIDYDDEVVRVHRLHILQRFHDYLARTDSPAEESAMRGHYAERLRRAYQDFVHSDARTEKVFKVFRHNEAKVSFVPRASLARRAS